MLFEICKLCINQQIADKFTLITGQYNYVESCKYTYPEINTHDKLFGEKKKKKTNTETHDTTKCLLDIVQSESS